MRPSATPLPPLPPPLPGVLYYGDSAANNVKASTYVTDLHSQADLQAFVRGQPENVLTVVNVALLRWARAMERGRAVAERSCMTGCQGWSWCRRFCRLLLLHQRKPLQPPPPPLPRPQRRAVHPHLPGGALPGHQLCGLRRLCAPGGGRRARPAARPQRHPGGQRPGPLPTCRRSTLPACLPLLCIRHAKPPPCPPRRCPPFCSTAAASPWAATWAAAAPT